MNILIRFDVMLYETRNPIKAVIKYHKSVEKDLQETYAIVSNIRP